MRIVQAREIGQNAADRSYTTSLALHRQFPAVFVHSRPLLCIDNVRYEIAEMVFATRLLGSSRPT